MKERIYVAPSANRKDGYPNRYFIFLKESLSQYYEVLESDNKPCLMQGLALLRNSFRADVFLLSFVETIAFQKLAFVQYLMAELGILIMRVRRRKIVFIFHNPYPHKGVNWMSNALTKRQLKHSCLVISHSKETAAFGQSKVVEYGGDPSKVVYVCHPVPMPENSGDVGVERSDYILIWGGILPYKGVLEFVTDSLVRSAGLKVRIIGRCKDSELRSRIEEAVVEPCPTVFTFENRFADFEELGRLVKESKAVLFPYLHGSVSSSGVLMDTVLMGGNPVGPRLGAFSDLAEDGVCRVYDSTEEMLSLLESDVTIDESTRERFLRNNSWQAFTAFIKERLDS